MPTFNINETVKVKLTEKGRLIMKQQFERLRKDYPQIGHWTGVPVDKEGCTAFQLWALMSLFGPEMYNGNTELPFDADIIIGK